MIGCSDVCSAPFAVHRELRSNDEREVMSDLAANGEMPVVDGTGGVLSDVGLA